MDNLFDRLNASTEFVRSHRDILNGYPSKFQDVSDEKHAEREKTHSDVNVDKQDGGKETSMQKPSGTKEERPSSFVIPKKKRRTTDVLFDVKVSSRDFQHEILPAITKSYRQPQSSSRFSYDQVQLVQNTYLTEAYMEKRRELRGCGYVEKELSDSFAFLCMDTENEDETNKICKEGLHIGNKADSCLGHPKMGVQLCKHADILKPVGLTSGYTGHLIVFKVMKGKIKLVMENRSGINLEPTPNHDCHVSSTTGNDLSSRNQQNLYESTQLYLYEYGDENVRDVPRNVCPVAVVRFTYNENHKDIKSPEMSSPKFPTRSPLSVKPVQSSPQIKGEDQKFVVWSGHLTVKGLYACSVEMISQAGPAKPSRIGKGINIAHKMPIAQARKKYLQRVTSIDRQREGYWNGYYVNVCELHPVISEGKSHFQKVMNYLGKHNCVAIRKLEKDVVLLLLTASELTFQLGLTKPHQYPVILYSIFLSRTSRKHGAVQTDPLAQTLAPANIPSGLCSDPRLREKTKPLHISLPLSQTVAHLSDSIKHSTVVSPSNTYTGLVCGQMPPPPSPTKGMRSTTRASPVVGVAPKRWEVSSPPPAFYPSQPPPPLTPPVMAPTSPIQGLRSPVHAPLSPINHWTLIPPPPPPPTPPPLTPIQGLTPESPHLAQSMDMVHYTYNPIPSPVTSPMTHSLSPSQPLQYCLPMKGPVHSNGGNQDPRDQLRDPREKSRDPRHRDYARSPREHARGPQPGYMSPVSVHHDPTLGGEKSPASTGPLTSSPHHPTQPPPKLQTPPPLSPRHELQGTRFESPRHFSSYPPKTSLLFSDQMKSEFKKQAKTLESITQRNWNKSQTPTKQSNCLFSTSSDSDSEMSDSEMNRIVKQLRSTDESMDTEGSTKGSPSKPLPEVNCIEAVTDMKELLNKRLDKSTEKKTEKIKDLKKQEAEAMLQLLNSAVCDKNRQHKGKVGAECKQKQTIFSVRPLPHKNNQDIKTCTDKIKTSKMDRVHSKTLSGHTPSESIRQTSSKKQEHKLIHSGKSISVTESKMINMSQINIPKTSDRKSSQSQQEASSSISTSLGGILEKIKEQKSTKNHSRTSSISSQSGNSSNNEKKSVTKTTSLKSSKKMEQIDGKSERLKTFAEKYDESCKLLQNHDHKTQKTYSKHTTTSSSKITPVTAKDIPFLLVADKSQAKSIHPEQNLQSKVKNLSNKVRARAYSSSEIENSHKISEEQLNSVPKKPKLDPTVSIEKSSLWNKVNPGTSKKTVAVVGEKQQTSEKKLSFKIKGPKSLLKKDPLNVNKGGKRSLKCGKSSSSSAKRTDPVKEKRKIKSWVGTDREKCSIEDILPGLYNSEKCKLGRIPKLSKIPKKGQKSSKLDTALPFYSACKIQSSADVNTSPVLQSSRDIINSSDVEMSPALQSPSKSDFSLIQSSKVDLSSGLQSSGVSISSAIQSPSVNSSEQQSTDVCISTSATSESVPIATNKLAVIKLSSDVEETPMDSAVFPTDKHVDDTDKYAVKLLETKVQGPENTDTRSTEICSEDKISTNLVSLQTESLDKRRHVGDIKPYESDQCNNHIEESEDVPSLVSTLEQNVMINPVRKLNFPYQNSHNSSRDSSCRSSRNSFVERDSNTALKKRQKYLEKRVKVESPRDSIMKYINISAAVKRRSSLQGRSDNAQRRSPGLSSDSEISNDAIKSNFKLKTNVDMEKRLQKKFDKDHSEPINFEHSPLNHEINPDRLCNLTSMEITGKAAQIDEQSPKQSISTENVTLTLGYLHSMDPSTKSSHSKTLEPTETGETIVKDLKPPSSKRERSITPDIIPGLGDLPLSEVDLNYKSSNMVFDPLRLVETAGYSREITQSAKRERSVTPEIVIPGLGDLPLKDMYGDSKPSTIVFDPLKLANTAGYARKETSNPAKRERSITPEIVIPGLGDLPLKDMYGDSKPSTIVFDPLKLANTAGYARKETSNPAKRERSITPEIVIPGLGDLPLPNNHSNIVNSIESSKTAEVKPVETSADTDSTRVSHDKELSITTVDTFISEGSSPQLAGSSDKLSSLVVPIKPSGIASFVTTIARDDKHVTINSRDNVQYNDADDGELVVNRTRVVERAGRELKLRVSIPNNLCGDATVRLVTLDQTIRQTLHGHRQFSRLTPSENILMTTVNKVIHKKLNQNKDLRHVEDLNEQKVGNVLTQKNSSTPTMAELTRNLSPSLVEFARKHLLPCVVDFTRKHDPDMDAEPVDVVSDFASYESWGINRDNSTSTKAGKKCSEKNNHVGSTDKFGEIKSASPSTSSSSSNLRNVPASAFVSKKRSLVGKTFQDKTKTISVDVSSLDLARDVSLQSTAAVSSGYSSDLSDSSTVCIVNFVPRKDSSRTVGSGVTDKGQKKIKTPPVTSWKSPTEKGSSELNKAPDANGVEKYVNENSTSKVSATPPLEIGTLSFSKTSESASPLLSTELSETVSSSRRSPKTASSSSLSAIKSTESASSLLSSTRSTGTVSSAFSSTKSSENVSALCSSTRSIESASSLPSTKTSENKTLSSETASGRGLVVFSPIRLPDGNKLETVCKTLVEEPAKTNQVGAIRSDNQTSRKERKAQTHPYTRRHRQDSWSFDIPYRNLQELMRDLTTDTFKQKNVNVSKPQKSKGRIPRFRNYRFKRSSIPDCLPDSPDDSDEFTAEAIPDFEERKRKADKLECMQTSKKGDQEDYTAEESSYSPGATSAPAQAKDNSSVDKDTVSQGYTNDKTTLEKIQSESDSSSYNRKRRISQTCSPSRRRDWRLSRSRHNTGLGETTHFQSMEEDTSPGCRSKDSTPTDVKVGKYLFDSSLLRQGSREYSPSEFFYGTGEGKSSRENTPTDFTQDVDVSKMSQFVLGVPKVEEIQKRKIKVKRLDNNTEKGSSSSPVLVRSDDCNNPHMFQPIPTQKPTDSKEKDDLKDHIQQLKKEKENKFESDPVKASNEMLLLVKESRREKPHESNRISCPNNERITVVGQKTSEENATDEETKNDEDGNISDEDMSNWIVMDEFHCQEVSVLKEVVSHGDGDLENKPDDQDQPIRNFAEKPVTISADNDKNVRKDISGPVLQIQSVSPLTGTIESHSVDQYQVDKESVAAVEVTDNAVSKSPTQVPAMDGIKGKDLPTESEKISDFDTTDSLCTQTYTDVIEKSGLEIMRGDKIIIGNSDISISEIDHQFADASPFVPVIYLSGTKGRKILWAKELDQSEVTEENVSADRKTDNQSSMKEEICVSMEQGKSKLLSKEDITNMLQSEKKEEITSSLSDLNRTNNSSGPSLSVLKLKEEDGHISNQTSALSSQELVIQTSENIGTLSNNSTCEEMLEKNSTSLDNVSSEISRPGISQGTKDPIIRSANGGEYPNKQLAEERENTNTKVVKTSTENSNMKKASVDSIQVDDRGDGQQVTSSRSNNKSLYGYEEENVANTSVSSTRLDCSWDFTVKPDKVSSESVYGEYHTAAEIQILENSKGDDVSDIEAKDLQFASVCKELTDGTGVQAEKCSSTGVDSYDSHLYEEKPIIDSVNLSCENSTIIRMTESVNQRSEKNMTSKLEFQTNEVNIHQGTEPIIYPDGSIAAVQLNVPSVEEETVPCVGAEEETGTYIDAEDELLQATNTCALLCHGDMFTSVTGRDETGSSGQESSQESTNKCNLSFEAEYRENENELFELGEYCADLTYRLDRDMDLGHDVEVESIISQLEEGKDDNDISITCEQFEEVEKTNIHNVSIGKHHWQVLQSKLKHATGEKNFPEPKDSSPEFVNITRKSSTTVDVYKCLEKNDMDLYSNCTSFDRISLETQRTSPDQVLHSSVDQNNETKNDSKTMLLEKFTGYNQEESCHNNTKVLVAISDEEEFVPDSQEESDGDEAKMVNISNFLTSDDSHNGSQCPVLDKHLIEKQLLQPDNIASKSKFTEKIPFVESRVKISTPRVSPVADFFGLQCHTPTIQSTARPCTDYVYGMYKSTPEPGSEIPMEDTVEEIFEHESDDNTSRKFSLFVQNSPLNLSVSSKTRAGEGIPGMNSYVSPDCSDLADEEVSSHCGTNIQPVTSLNSSTSNLPGSNFYSSSPLNVTPEEMCPIRNAHAILLAGKSVDQSKISGDISSIPEQKCLTTEIEAPTLQPSTDKISSPKEEDFCLQPKFTPSNSDCCLTSSQESDFDESVPSQDLNGNKQQESSDQGQPTSSAEQSSPTPSSSEVDVSASTFKYEFVPQSQPDQGTEIGNIEDNPSFMPINYTSPQSWVTSPPQYGPNFWPYSPPLGYPPSTYFSYRPPLLQHPMHNYRIWRPPFYHYSDHRTIPLQQHGIMSSLDPCIHRCPVRKQLQANTTALCPMPMFDTRLPLYSSYTYSRSDTSYGNHEQGTSSGDRVNTVYPNSNLHTAMSSDQGRNLPHYSNVFMQYVVHKRPVLTNDTIMTSTPAARQQSSVSMTTTSLRLAQNAATQLPVVEAPSALNSISTPIGPAASKVTNNMCSVFVNCSKNTTDCNPCLVAPENIPLPDYPPPVTSTQTVPKTPATLPPITTFARKPELDRKSDGSNNSVHDEPELDLC